MHLHRAAWLLACRHGDPTAVIAGGGGDSMQPCCREPGKRAAEAIADDTDFSRRRRRGPRRLDVEQHVVHADLVDHRPADGESIRPVAELDAGLATIKQRRRDAVVAVGRVAVRDFSDMLVDAKNLLDDDEPASMLHPGRRLIGRKLVAVGCLQLDRLTHPAPSLHACAATLTSRTERSRFRSSATRKASSNACSALRRGSQ